MNIEYACVSHCVHAVVTVVLVGHNFEVKFYRHLSSLIVIAYRSVPTRIFPSTNV